LFKEKSKKSFAVFSYSEKWLTKHECDKDKTDNNRTLVVRPSFSGRSCLVVEKLANTVVKDFIF